MKINYFIYILVLCSLTISCLKDKGNYDLHAINEISLITNATETMDIQQFDTLRLNVELDQTIPVDESELTFRWNAYPYPQGGTNVELGDQKSLVASIGMKPGNYTLQYTITDTKTDISRIETFLLVVSGKLSEGWLVLDSKGDNTQDVHIITPDKTIIRDLYHSANDMPLPQNAHMVRVLNASREQHIFVYGEHDARQVENSSFANIRNLNSWFVGEQTTGHVDAHAYTKFAFGAFVVLDGDVYVYGQIPTILTQYGPALRGDWKLSRYIFPKDFSGECIFYDTKNQRFLIHQFNSMRMFSNPEGAAFDLNNVGKTLVFGGPSLTSYFNCLMKDNDQDKFYVYRINYSSLVVAAEKYDVEDAPDLERAQFFASSGLFLHMYYAVDNKVYLLDIPAKKARLMYTFPAGEAITALELKQSYGLTVFYPDNNKTMAIATKNGNDGKLYTFSLNNTGDFENNSYTDVYEGFGLITDLEYKNKPL